MRSGLPSVLSINGGSSSIRFAVYEAGETPRRRLDGKIDRIGGRGTNLSVNGPVGTPPVPHRLGAADHQATVTTPFDMTVLNDLDRFHLVMDTVDRLPQTGEEGVRLKQQLEDRLIEHKQHIDRYGVDLPEICNWEWDAGV